MSRSPLAAIVLGVALPASAIANPFTLPFRMAAAGAKAMHSAGQAAGKAALRGDLLAAAGHLNPVNLTVLGYQKLTAPEAHAQDPSSWAPSFRSGPVSQRGMVDDDGRLFMQTRVKVRSSDATIAQRAEQKFRSSWSDFGFGGDYQPLSHEEYQRRTGQRPEADAVTYQLAPPMIHNKAPGGLIKVNEKLRTRLDGRHMSGSLRLDGHVVGPAHVAVAPSGAEHVLEGGFDGVTIGGAAKLLGPATMGLMHGAVEHQGFRNLGRVLER